ncbi:EAL domain-containing protein [Halovulum sp. GXIMD14793]
MVSERNRIAVWQSIGDAVPYLTTKCEASLAQRAKMRSVVAHTLAEDRVCLVYQPVVSTHAGRPVTFYEGLMRLRDTDGSLIKPDAYLPFVEGTTLSLALDVEVLRLAIRALADNPWLRLSVNITPFTVANDDWIATLKAAAQAAPDIAFRLIVEITESSSLLDQPKALDFITELRALGCSTALDDFGAGTTSFRHLRAYRFDIIKIDGSFCCGLAGSADSQALVRALVEMARHFEMMTVAEYIETEDDAAKATELGVDAIQGYLIGRPLQELVDPWAQRDSA